MDAWWCPAPVQYVSVAAASLLLAIALVKLFLKKEAWVLDPSEESVLVTGCDSGIGHECALLYDRLGFRVFAGCLSATGQGAQRLMREGSNVRVLHLDITDEQSVKRAYETIASSTGDHGLWSLVNNAGIMCYGEFEWLTMKQCQKQIDVNITGTIRMTKTFLPLILKRKGRILTMSSVNGLLSYPGQSVYSATKFALEGFCDALRAELLKSGVRVISIRPGDFARLTGIFASHDDDVRDMWQDMDEERRKRHGQYFWRFHKVAKEKHGLTSPRSFGHSRLFDDLRDAVMSERPNNCYLVMPLLQKMVVWTLMVLPSSIRARLLAFVFSKVFEAHLE